MRSNLKEQTILKLGIVLTLIFGCPSTNIQAQETTPNTINVETQADKDWKTLNDVMRYFGPVGGYGTAIEKGALEQLRYEDAYFKKRSRLAKAFWDNYPQDSRHDRALYLFFSPYAKPHFIQEIVPDSLIQLLASIPKHDEQLARLLPFNALAREQWLKTGDAMVASVLNSKASLERKEAAAFQLIAREFRKTIWLSFGLEKEKSESQYWNRFEIQYWQHIRLRLENHVIKYAALKKAADRVQNILNLLKPYAIAATESYWKYFFEAYGNDHHPLLDQSGIKALHTLAAENIAAVDALKEVDFSKPLDLAFTAMDGTKVDLANMRGKVVLIDFWSTYCGPCIKEMPHVRKMYDKYRDQGFEVIGIAANNDGARESILGILKKTSANWPQRLDQASDVSVSLHALYNIIALPTVWLLNKEGVIVDRNARGERLEPLIREYLGLE